ncbi:MAG: M48 family metallopeptidase [Gammaproteobacteria bacterium]|nr:M48 family metallopeptidase [Gammaproteobacteria bacterium]
MQLEGYLTDGATAARHTVRVTPTPTGLELIDAQGRALERWGYDGLALAEEVYRGQPVRLRHRAHGEARLTLPDPEALAALCRFEPRLCRRYYSGRHTLTRLVAWSLALAAVIVGLVVGVPRLAEPLARAVPLEWETALGNHVVESGLPLAPRCEGADGREVLDALTRRLAATVETPYTFRVAVTADEAVNAFAAPGGRIVLFHGLIEFAEGPDEVVGVLAHEVAHVVARHPMEALLRDAGYRLLFTALTGDASAAGAAAAGVGESLIALSYSRADEVEADRMGVEMMNRAGLRSTGLTEFFDRMRAREGDLPEGLAFLSTHPLHAERVQELRPRVRGTGESLGPARWRALRRMCAESQPEPTGL